MAAENHRAVEQGDVLQSPADKTDAPHHVREDKIKNLITTRFMTCESSTPLGEVIKRMREDENNCAILCEGERVVGLFTEREVLKVVGTGVDLSTPVKELMSREVATLDSEATLRQAVRLMNERHFYLPITEDERIIGAISIFDLFTYLAESYPKETINLPPRPAQVMDTPEGG